MTDDSNGKLPNLTDRQLYALRAINSWICLHGFAPSNLDLCDELKIASTNGVRKLLNVLEGKGLITREYATARSIVITPLGRDMVFLGAMTTGEFTDKGDT